MLPVNVLLSIAVFALIGLIMIIFLLPATSSYQKKKKEQSVEQRPKEKDWQDAALKLERHIQSLKREIEGLEKTIRTNEEVLAQEKQKNIQLTQKLKQEQGRHDREEKTIE